MQMPPKSALYNIKKSAESDILPVILNLGDISALFVDALCEFFLCHVQLLARRSYLIAYAKRCKFVFEPVAFGSTHGAVIFVLKLVECLQIISTLFIYIIE